MYVSNVKSLYYTPQSFARLSYYGTIFQGEKEYCSVTATLPLTILMYIYLFEHFHDK
jgi:hypothetical protein